MTKRFTYYFRKFFPKKKEEDSNIKSQYAEKGADVEYQDTKEKPGPGSQHTEIANDINHYFQGHEEDWSKIVVDIRAHLVSNFIKKLLFLDLPPCFAYTLIIKGRKNNRLICFKCFFLHDYSSYNFELMNDFMMSISSANTSLDPNKFKCSNCKTKWEKP